MIYGAGSQLLKKQPILFRVFRRRKVNTVFALQLLTAETQECAKRRIDEEWLPIHVFDGNANRACVEQIFEKLSVRHERM
jgi:hypothetical protein